jgi:hypothetical protein
VGILRGGVAFEDDHVQRGMLWAAVLFEGGVENHDMRTCGRQRGAVRRSDA